MFVGGMVLRECHSKSGVIACYSNVRGSLSSLLPLQFTLNDAFL